MWGKRGKEKWRERERARGEEHARENESHVFVYVRSNIDRLHADVSGILLV